MKTVTITKNDSGQRLDKFLTKSYPDLPQSMMYKSIRKKDIKLNGKRCEISTRLQEGDVLSMYLKDEFFERDPYEYEFLKAPAKLNILYEDENIMILDKKPGLIVHPDENYHFDSLIARIHRVLFERGEYNPEQENAFAPALINRIDRNTGGIVMAAKNAETLRIMNEKVRLREIDKFYLCIVNGKMPQKEALLKAFLEKDTAKNRVYVHDKPQANTKTILTKYKVLKEKKEFSLLEVELLTGRTHQIRAHLSYIGHPLAGDSKYGLNAVNRKLGMPYQALYSYKLHFDFQTDAGILQNLNNMTFSAGDIWFLEEFESWKN
ncbi:RluA family pseudouridine synthase [Scatolibacter rhodanostii]|uniref:RluA family pseudouridine synthase n=1 Tax=Scatolibacter rhodanostii TaxID=2014781 RepID=UPI000C07367A|nr:RluA family pseudouridine synthase [Scatolibacter rhodanostii]